MFSDICSFLFLTCVMVLVCLLIRMIFLEDKKNDDETKM